MENQGLTESIPVVRELAGGNGVDAMLQPYLDSKVHPRVQASSDDLDRTLLPRVTIGNTSEHAPLAPVKKGSHQDVARCAVEQTSKFDSGTSYLITADKNAVTIKHVDGHQTKMVLDGDRGFHVKSAEFTGKGGTPLGHIGSTSDGLYYRYETKDQGPVTEPLKDAYQIDGNVHMVTADGRKIERRADGSVLERDQEDRPVLLTDANGNCFAYKWNAESENPIQITIQGPGTKGDIITLEPKTVLDRVLDGASAAVLGATVGAAPFKRISHSDYKISVNSRPLDSNVGVAAGLQSGPASIGIGGLAQAGAEAIVLADGTLIVKYTCTGVNGMLHGEKVAEHFRADGTQIHKKTSYFGGPVVTQVSRTARPSEHARAPKQ